MATAILEREGAAEEIQEWLDGFSGQRLHVTVTPAEDDETAENEDITAKILKRFANSLPEERTKVPADLTDNLDHYIYGLSKIGSMSEHSARCDERGRQFTG